MITCEEAEDWNPCSNPLASKQEPHTKDSWKMAWHLKVVISWGASYSSLQGCEQQVRTFNDNGSVTNKKKSNQQKEVQPTRIPLGACPLNLLMSRISPFYFWNLLLLFWSALWCTMDICIYDRRKFRSETSDNMDSWKAEVKRVRREKIRRKKR